MVGVVTAPFYASRWPVSAYDRSCDRPTLAQVLWSG